jgi:long-subunit fatty acid transport protein
VRSQRLCIGWLLLTAAASTARANLPEDVYGLSARTIAMGGAGTALPGDFAAVHYNPAGLALCRADLVAVEAGGLVHNLGFADNRGGSTKLTPRANDDQGRFTFGSCLGLPFDLSLGLAVGVGYPHSVDVDQQTANQQPTYVMYGQNHEQLSFAAGLGWRAAKWLSVGVGLAVLVHSQLPVTATIPVAVPDPANPGMSQPVSFAVALGIGGAVAPRLGVLFSPLDRLRVGFAYRGSLYHDLSIDTNLKVQTVLVDVPVPLHLDSLSWFSPEQVSLGASFEPVDMLTLTSEATWYHFGALGNNTYPFVNLYSTAPPGSPAEALTFPTVEHPGWQDVIALRGGAEVRVLEDRIALRGGLGWRNAAVAGQDASNVNLLDGATLTVAGGVGAYFGKRAPTPGHLPDPGPRPRRQVGGYDIPDFSGSVEAFVRVDAMANQTVVHHHTGANDPVPEKNYEFGGSVLQLGLMATLTW